MTKKSIWKRLPALLSMTMLTACQAASSREPLRVSAGALSEEYDRSSDVVRGKYDGKEIIVRGYIETPATMPKPGDDQGSVSLKEKGHQPGQQVTCWFSKDQTAEFSKIRGDQYITVKGVFNGEAGAELKFCKLIGTE